MQPGDVLADRFEVLRRVASGGMGTVWQGKDRTTGGEVAIKVHDKTSDDSIERFRLEAQLLETLDHPNIVKYLGHGTGLRGEHFIVEEWLPGLTLTESLKMTGLSTMEAVEMTRQIATALSEVHARGIIHRDIKPSNIMLHEDSWKLLDFGVARVMDHAVRLTRTGTVVGTIGFMSPEQARADRQIGPSADVFALGCVLYLCLVRRRPFRGNSAVAVQAQVIAGHPPPAAAERPEIPAGLSSLVQRMMAKSPDERPPDAMTVAMALEAMVIGGNLSRKRPTYPVAKPVPPTPPTATIGSAEQTIATEHQSATGITAMVVTGPLSAVVETDDISSAAHSLVQALDPLGGEPAVTVDGSLIYATPTDGDADYRIAQAVAGAQKIRSLYPDLPVAIASAWQYDDLGQALDDAAHTISAKSVANIFADFMPGGGESHIQIDALTAKHLPAGFRAEVREGAMVLIEPA